MVLRPTGPAKLQGGQIGAALGRTTFGLGRAVGVVGTILARSLVAAAAGVGTEGGTGSTARAVLLGSAGAAHPALRRARCVVAAAVGLEAGAIGIDSAAGFDDDLVGPNVDNATLRAISGKRFGWLERPTIDDLDVAEGSRQHHLRFSRAASDETVCERLDQVERRTVDRLDLIQFPGTASGAVAAHGLVDHDVAAAVEGARIAHLQRRFALVANGPGRILVGGKGIGHHQVVGRRKARRIISVEVHQYFGRGGVHQVDVSRGRPVGRQPPLLHVRHNGAIAFHGPATAAGNQLLEGSLHRAGADLRLAVVELHRIRIEGIRVDVDGLDTANAAQVKSRIGQHRVLRGPARFDALGPGEVDFIGIDALETIDVERRTAFLVSRSEGECHVFGTDALRTGDVGGHASADP